MRHCTKLYSDPSNRCWVMAISRLFNMAAIRHLGFLRLEFVTVCTVQRVNVRRYAKFVLIGQIVAEIWRFFDFFWKWRPSSSWICYMHVWSTQDECLVVFITVQNLVGTDAVQSFSHSSRQSDPVIYNGSRLPPNCPLPTGVSGPASKPWAHPSP